MTAAEILAELEKLTDEELEDIQDRIFELQEERTVSVDSIDEEEEDEEEDSDDADEADEADEESDWIGGSTAESSRPKKKLKIDFTDIHQGLEYSNSGNVYYLDTETGEVIPVFADAEDLCAEDRERIEGAKIGRFEQVEALSSHESFRIMENFADSLTASRPKARLLEALSRNKPFRRFKDEIYNLGLRDEWHAFHSESLRGYAAKWLKGLGIEVEWKNPFVD